jgi:hypothetical protein
MLTGGSRRFRRRRGTRHDDDDNQEGTDVKGRLHLQHWIFTYQLGYLLHPKIELDDKKLKIADVACGNGYNTARIQHHGDHD